MPTEGDVLNQRYQILRVLSDKGGMGVIYQATDLTFNNTVCIKHSRFTEQFLKQQYPATPLEELRRKAEHLRKAFEREARLVRGLKHNALPSVIDYFTTGDGHQFFVMDFIPGKDFGELLDERLQQSQTPFPLDQVLYWADQLLDALDYLHTRFESPIIHRDIKPLNLKLTPDGQIVLLDFGLAKGATPGMSVVSASIHGYTLNYAPLEQIRGKGTAVLSDLYSLAVTLHHLLSGAVPPSAVDRIADTTSGEADPLRPLHEINPQIPTAFSTILQCAAALNPNERYATATEMREALRSAGVPEPARSTVNLPDNSLNRRSMNYLLPLTERAEFVDDTQQVKAPTIEHSQPPIEVHEVGRVQIDLSGSSTGQPEIKQPRDNRWRYAVASVGLILALSVIAAISWDTAISPELESKINAQSSPVITSTQPVQQPTIAPSSPVTTPTRPVQQPESKPIQSPTQNVTASRRTAPTKNVAQMIPTPDVLPPANKGNLTLQVAGFNNPAQANERASSYRSKGVPARVVSIDIPGKGTWHRVQIGQFVSREDASSYANQLKSKGLLQDYIVTTIGK